ncbi:molybdopterin molybdotransferase [Oceanospirillum multiglobuliferum]|uniref:Molybdopterin molybdenumtransferase n=1 Tax=Oceanospirillum multiglobuliferum TaxID=64969 RepID=A0A1T4R5Y0_9GAMM|nr:bifunctional molybdopterin-guanine dinucleotide biosynthesis adaptor protein MobB/molybdopterin molybdotransferase MoeA [Oceanospirillum multiglobuliferum]OPX55218.1 bifunctional molybdopterin-guanine dinucleotide biosynthesis adaptor protein MobB/molybdopterin molybdotransferase MoeA [Oceanospirillum multiglobuliferum]SKA11349.1 molybdopterin molybdotransferase [Oceanospirillum multiglobuliferum]
MSVSCFDLSPKTLSLNEGRQQLLDQIASATPPEHQLCHIEQLSGKVLAEDLISPINVPAQTNAAMDGFAIQIPEGQGALATYKRVGSAFAGKGFSGVLNEGEAVLITTGAPIPVGANTVVMKELCTLDGEHVRFNATEQVKRHDNIRQAGEDLSKGQVALTRGTRLRPAHQGLIASLGLEQVEVYRPLKVAVFSTGDEVVAQGQPLPAASIYDTNRFSLIALLQALHCEVIDLGILPDQEAALAQGLSQAAQQADVVISSGGVSVGDADYIKSALAQVGETAFWRLNIRPGRPFAFGYIHKTDKTQALFLGLPGNPVAVMVTFLQLAQPALRQLQGEQNWQVQSLPAIAAETMRSREGRTDFHRGIFSVNTGGQLVVRTTGSQGSGILRSMVEANCLIQIPDPIARVQEGDLLIIHPFADLL